MEKEKTSNKVKAHQRYKLKDGTIVPGCSTITGLRAKPMLIKWSNNLGLAGIDSSKYVDEKAEIGTLAHYLILQHLSKQKPDTSEYSPAVVDIAENCFLKFLAWEQKHKIEPILLEAELISELEKFGGCVDFYGKVDGVLSLVDFKSCKNIYDDHFNQIAGYEILLIENNYPVDNRRILRIGRSEDEGFEEKEKKDLSLQKIIFRSLLTIYHTEKMLKEQ
jgi:hypothetical protein